MQNPEEGNGNYSAINMPSKTKQNIKKRENIVKNK